MQAPYNETLQPSTQIEVAELNRWIICAIFLLAVVPIYLLFFTFGWTLRGLLITIRNIIPSNATGTPNLSAIPSRHSRFLPH